MAVSLYYLGTVAIVMRPDGGDRYSYTAGGAKIYSTLGLEGTTYEIGYDRVRELLGDSVTGRIFLDFGCGAGRSTAFLRALGARHVYSVDHDQNMIDMALAAGLDGVEFLSLPIPYHCRMNQLTARSA